MSQHLHRSFSAPLVAAAALATSLLACGNTVVMGQGGSTSATGAQGTSTAQTSATTGQSVTTTTHAASTTVGATTTGVTSSTGAGMVNPHCTAVCDKGMQLETQLNCTPSTTNCTTSCQGLYAMYPQCSTQIDAFLACITQQSSATTCKCDPTSMNQLKCSAICTQEQQAVTTCVGG